jgi:citrate lyase beta subunit
MSERSRLSVGASIKTVLFVPGSTPERFEKALSSDADIACIDLEDAVAPDRKWLARSAAIAAITRGDERLALRINPLDTAEGLQDLLALKEIQRRPALLFLPMVESARDVAIVSSILGTDSSIVVPLIETVSALRVAHEIASAPGVAAMMFGGGDLSAQLGVELSWEPLAAARAQFVLACAGRGIGILDVPYTHLEDLAGLKEETARAKALGFTAKAAIHPKQVATINRVFCPSEEEIAEAYAALQAYRAAGGKAIRYKGQMLEAPLIRRFEAILTNQEKLDA